MKSSSPVSCRPAENAMAQPLRRAFARSARDAPQPSTHPHVRVSCVYLLLPCSFGAKDEDCLAPKVKVRGIRLVSPMPRLVGGRPPVRAPCRRAQCPPGAGAAAAAAAMAAAAAALPERRPRLCGVPLTAAFAAALWRHVPGRGLDPGLLGEGAQNPQNWAAERRGEPVRQGLAPSQERPSGWGRWRAHFAPGAQCRLRCVGARGGRLLRRPGDFAV